MATTSAPESTTRPAPAAQPASSQITGYSSSGAQLDLGRPQGRRQFVDNLMKVLIWGSAVLAIIPLVWILVTVIMRGAPLLFSTQPDFTRICAVADSKHGEGFADFKRVPDADCATAGGAAKWTWLNAGGYPAVGAFVKYNPVEPTTQDPNQTSGGIVVAGQAPAAAGTKVIGYPNSEGEGVVRSFSLNWWTKDQSVTQPMSVGGGALHAIVGTLTIGLLTSLIAVPLGVLGAVYLVEYARGTRMAKLVSFMVDILTGVPSIVAALFIYAVVITLFGFGRSTFAASLALVLLMLPTVLRSTEEMLKLVPDSLREASYALGVPKWKTILSVVVPTSFTGIATGVVLGVARVMGETAPLLILLNYGPKLELNPFSVNMGSLPTMITGAANLAPSYPGAERGWGAALTLILLVMGLNLIARTVGARAKSKKR